MYTLLILIFYCSIFFVILAISYRYLNIGVVGLVFFGFLLLSLTFFDVLLTQGLMMKFERDYKPLQKIYKIIEDPQSIYWVDDIWPGFDEYGRRWMVEHYLGGNKLKTLALNDGDGRMYIYHATQRDYHLSSIQYKKFEKIKKKSEVLTKKIQKAKLNGEDPRKLIDIYQNDYQVERREVARIYKELLKKDIDSILSKSTIISRKEFLENIQEYGMRYGINLKQIDYPKWQNSFIWCDEISIKDKIENFEIGFSKRCLGRQYNFMKLLFPGFAGEFGGSYVGERYVYEFDAKTMHGDRETKYSYKMDRSFFK